MFNHFTISAQDELICETWTIVTVTETEKMSGFIPIVSSSPPPFDEVPSFEGNDDEGWDDFTGFTGSTAVDTIQESKPDGFFIPIEPPALDVSLQYTSEHEQFAAFDDPGPVVQDQDNWAEFSSASQPSDHADKDDSKFESTPHIESRNASGQKLDGESSSDSCDQDLCDSTFGKQETLSSPDDCPVAKTSSRESGQSGSQPEVTSQGSAADSGLSSDVSPGLKPGGDIAVDFAAESVGSSSVLHEEDSNSDSGTDAEGVTSVAAEGVTSVAAEGVTSVSSKGVTSVSSEGVTSVSSEGVTSVSSEAVTLVSSEGVTSVSSDGVTSVSSDGVTSVSSDGVTSVSSDGVTSVSSDGVTSESDNTATTAQGTNTGESIQHSHCSDDDADQTLSATLNRPTSDYDNEKTVKPNLVVSSNQADSESVIGDSGECDLTVEDDSQNVFDGTNTCTDPSAPDITSDHTPCSTVPSPDLQSDISPGETSLPSSKHQDLQSSKIDSETEHIPLAPGHDSPLDEGDVGDSEDISDNPSHEDNQSCTKRFDDVNVDDNEEFHDFSERCGVSDDDEVASNEKEPDDLCFKSPSFVPDEVSPVESLDLKIPALSTPQDEADEWGDDFADFQDAAPVPDLTNQETDSGGWAAFGGPVAPEQETGDDWAAFGAGADSDIPSTHISSGDETKPHQDEDEDEDDEFGAFEDVPTSDFRTTASIIQAAADINHINKLVSIGFPTTAQDASVQLELFLLLHYMAEKNCKPVTTEEKNHPKGKIPMMDLCVWNNLKDVNNTAALKYSWQGSANNQKLLRTCNIDTRNILLGHKKPSVPIFYQQAVLEPSRGPVEPQKEASTPVTESPLVPDTSAPSSQTVISPSIPSTASNGIPGAATPQDIPPAEFDWSSSGLTNPLDASSRIHLDLDFFVQKDNIHGRSSVPNSKALQQEQEILQALETPAGGRPQPPKTLQSIETILAGMKFTPTTPITAEKEVLSEEAQAVLSKLPNLSFMQASVLMFPLQVNGDHANE